MSWAMNSHLDKPHRLTPEQVDRLQDEIRSSWLSKRDALQAADRERAPEARAADAAVGNLEIVTHNDFDLLPGTLPGPDVWNFQVVEYRSGVVEARAYRGEIAARVVRQTSRELTDDRERFEFSIQRSRRILRSRCLQLDADVLWTFTKRGKFATQDELWQAFERFNKLMARRFRGQWRYVAVPELHSDGATWHLHVGVKGFFAVEALRVCWQRALGGRGNERGSESLGNVQAKFFKFRRGRRKAASVAAYIAKYIGKGFGPQDRGRKLVATSRGLQPDRVRRFHMRHFFGTTKEVAQALYRRLQVEGICTEATLYFWSRHRNETLPGEQDSPPWLQGFVLTTERPL